MKKIGIALGAGGARGLAHIIILEVFEELGIKPHIISGSSIGAIVGAAYASGMTTKEMKSSVEELILSKDFKLMEFYKKYDVFKIIDMLGVSISTSGFFKGDRFITYFKEKVKTYKFTDLEIPIKIVATEYWNKKEHHFTSGNLIDAVRASYALPALFTPMKIKDALYYDGGMVNPLPYDIIQKECDYIIAVDVSSKKGISSKDVPNALDSLFAAFQIMQNSILKEKLKSSKPNIMLEIDIKDVRMFEFNKVEAIWKEAKKYKKILKNELRKIM
ncbi:MAG: patatin-like phospholipase family protein [Bacteroidetes bacterium]|nr:patatin-like phospholipase family protein [Bacteroidota bacterium]MBU1115466.1 patatin-like phospholipase family protein [Bacteroidota bacterium]MBU1800089.1 patatin-like phospholipase family protein [Bacteroidota bacterium]